MNTSESIKAIAPAILKAQKAITFAVKDAKNPHFKSTYADLSSVIDAVKPALNDAGISFLQMMAPSDRDSLALTTRLIHESGEWIESTATCPLAKNDPQGYGSACTYLKRYSLASAVGLYQEDDDGNAASKPVKTAAPRIPATAKADESGMTPERRKQIDSAAACAIEAFGKGNEVAAYEVVSDIQETEEKLYLWNILHLHSALRASLKKLAQADKTPVTA
jgi:hypothetical protein